MAKMCCVAALQLRGTAKGSFAESLFPIVSEGSPPSVFARTTGRTGHLFLIGESILEVLEVVIPRREHIRRAAISTFLPLDQMTLECEDNCIWFWSLLQIAPENEMLCDAASQELLRKRPDLPYRCVDSGICFLPDVLLRERCSLIRLLDDDRPIPKVVSEDHVVNTIPRRFGYFVGRQSEIGLAIDAINDQGVVFLTGVGGVGKSHLASRVASELLDEFANGVAWVSLGEAQGRDDFQQALASGIQRSSMPWPKTRALLSRSQILVVLDAADSQLEFARELVKQLSGTQVRFIVTARRVDAPGDQPVVTLGPMILPPPEMHLDFDDLYDFDSTALFADRAAEIWPQIKNVAAPEEIADLVRVLGGHPRAIATVAALSSTHAISSMLRLALKNGGDSGVNAIIDAALEELPADEMELLKFVACAKSETPRSSAIKAANDDLEVVASLRMAGLLVEDLSSSGVFTYSVSDLVKSRLFRKWPAKERSGIRAKRAAQLLNWLRESCSTSDAGQLEIFDSLSTDLEDAFDHVASTEGLNRLVDEIKRAWLYIYSRSLSGLVETLGDLYLPRIRRRETTAGAELLNICGVLQTKVGKCDSARSSYLQARALLRLAPKSDLDAKIAVNLAVLEWTSGKTYLAQGTIGDAIFSLRQLDDDQQLARSLVTNSSILSECFEPTAARNSIEEAISLGYGVGSFEQWCLCLALAQVNWAEQNYNASTKLGSESVQRAVSLGDPLATARSAIWLSQALFDGGNHPASARVLAFACPEYPRSKADLYESNRIRIETLRSSIIASLGEESFARETIIGAVDGLTPLLDSL